jgi:uncharacterized tellurite resistance protein B-like protein
MGLFDRLFNSNSFSKNGYTPRSENEAWVSLLYACMAVDGDISEAETDSFIRLLVFKSRFANVDIAPLYQTAMEVKKQTGPQYMIDQCAPLIHADDRLTILALATELVLADGIIADDEQELLEYVSQKLNIDTPTATKIIEVILIKNKGNRIIID